MNSNIVFVENVANWNPTKVAQIFRLGLANCIAAPHNARAQCGFGYSDWLCQILSSLSQNSGGDDPHEFPTQQARRRDALSGDLSRCLVACHYSSLPLFRQQPDLRAPHSIAIHGIAPIGVRAQKLWVCGTSCCEQPPADRCQGRYGGTSPGYLRSLPHPSCFLGLCRRGNCSCLSLKHALSPLRGLCAKSRRAWTCYIITSTSWKPR